MKAPQRRPQSAGGQQYRLYFLEGADGRISLVHEFEADGDARAIGISEGWREGRRAELWNGARLIRAWDSD